jgi:hypothetical protein
MKITSNTKMNRMTISSGVAAVFLGQSCLHAAGASEGTFQVALEHSGENRAELETSLRKLKGKDTEYLISHASQYDLVNRTAEMVIENVTCARKVHVELPYLGKKLDDELWREWVLPQRVLDEDL